MANADDIMKRVSDFILNDDMEKTFTDFAKQHAPAFAGSLDGDENKLELQNVYIKFQELFERKLEEFIAKEGLTNKQFYEICKNIDSREEYASSMLQVLVALSDFDIFKSLMKESAS
mmetsp:Transcript_6066/g.9325  ORF Transcript_6066/g.9325 Transcript_6066/m.9325 type:complete len:117 (-) Transcript_6066:2034-2384(-)|eukprot:CAMPEP_0184658906 /NCGR_PEP_ID=MMETSP0308-20130426/27279_1 /TAXON_ID=38269 /ORGANISM="Gloeochaete witrockiana, Strain SAG 46.84" /LENGTH=116 /DNA_ID=CAMNT_0027098251 /DNA_START=135 /DNA_END=485 /DNA_ORIENTATION=+